MAGLRTYRAKRDFDVTAEPRGRVTRRKAEPLRFVIQRHAATRLHYDLRLELDGVYKSWAVTKVPSLDPATKRLAVEVEDHPLEYGTFEGTIPKGQYGGGTVQLWDRGTWKTKSENPQQDLAKGMLKFELAGKRMHGGWALIRMRDDVRRGAKSPRHNWLLVKERDDAARPGDPDAFLIEDTSVATGRTLDEIASSRRSRVWQSNRSGDAERAGSVKSHAKAADGLKKNSQHKKKDAEAKRRRVKVPAFVAPQLCRLVDHPPVGAVWVHEIKFDGYRIQVRVENGHVILRTRKALDWSNRFPEILREGEQFPDCMMDGEICALDKHGLPNFAELQQALSDGNTGNLICFAFDLIFLEGEDLRALPLEVRKSRLAELIAGSKSAPHFRYVEHFETPGEKFLQTACRAQLEGIISKRRDSPYRSGRTDLWCKEKCRGGQEIVIGGWWGGPTKLRSILAGSYEGNDFVYRGRIGTGFNGENSGPLLRALNRIRQDKSPFTAGVKPPRAREITWVAPKLVAEVEYATLTRDGVLRQASFKALRGDKRATSVILEQPLRVQEAEERSEGEMTMTADAAISTRRKASSSHNPGSDRVAGITISSPEKVLWPETKSTPALTKLDLARYYEAIASRMLPHIVDRPISMVRAPEGITGEKFFQRHVMAGVAAVKPMRIVGEKQSFHAISDLQGLVALAQAAVIEIHPWGCRPGEPEIPELLVFDLDPDPDLPFLNVIEAAREMRSLLRKCGLTPFVKTTGGKGLHVVTAITGSARRPPSWDQAKDFARQVSERLARMAPERYVTNMAKRHRGGKIFLDFHRNGRMATAVGPWSTRAHPGATIAMPLPWTQLRGALEPASFNLRDFKAVLKLKNPWTDLAHSAAPLEDARRNLQAI